MKNFETFKGFATIKFAKYNTKGSTHGKLNQGLKTGKCFILSDNNIREIRGNVFNNRLKVKRFFGNCITSIITRSETFDYKWHLMIFRALFT